MPLPTRRQDRTKLTDPSKRRAPKQEKDLARVLGGTTIKGSGAGVVKGDVRVTGFARAEAKCTRQKSYALTLGTIGKLEDAAASSGKMEIPVLHVEFLTPEGRRIKGLYVMLEDDAEELLRRGSDASTTRPTESARGHLPKARR